MSVVATDDYKTLLRLPQDIADKLKEQADKERVSLNTLIVRILAGLTPPPK